MLLGSDEFIHNCSTDVHYCILVCHSCLNVVAKICLPRIVDAVVFTAAEHASVT